MLRALMTMAGKTASEPPECSYPLECGECLTLDGALPGAAAGLLFWTKWQGGTPLPCLLSALWLEWVLQRHTG